MEENKTNENRQEIKGKEEFKDGEESSKSEQNIAELMNGNGRKRNAEKTTTILGPQLLHILAMIAVYLDPATFMRLIHSCKMIYSWAEHGYLKVPVHLDCKAYNENCGSTNPEDAEPILSFKGRVLSYWDVISLSRARYFKVEIGQLRIIAYHDMFTQFTDRFMDLMAILKVKTIGEAKFIESFGLERYSKFAIKKLEWIGGDSDFLKSPFLRQIEEVKLNVEYMSTEEERDIENVMDFIENTTATRMHMEFLPLPFKSIIGLINKWMAGKFPIRYFYIVMGWDGYSADLFPNLKLDNEENETEADGGSDDEQEDENAAISAEMRILRDTKTVKLEKDLRSVKADFIKSVIHDKAPLILLGTEKSLVFVNTAKEMLLVYFEDVGYGEGVTLKTLKTL